MSLKKALLVAGITMLGLGVFVVTGIGGYLAVRAAATGQTFPAIIQNLASKFNLNPTDVQQVFKDTRTQQFSNRLDQAVTNKQITADQKTLILNKITDIENQTNAINNQQLTAADRASKLQQLRSDTLKWASDNNIPSQFVLGMGFGRVRGGFGKGMMGGGMMGGF